MSGFKNILRLSLRDYSYERLLSICAILGLAAILAPLLVLFGVKNGIINTMADRLIEDPRNREVSPVGSGRYGLDWLAGMGARQDVAFIIPQTRSIAASMALYRPDEAAPSVVNVDLIPTAEGDPLLEKWGQIPLTDTSIVLTEPAARKLNASAGQEVIGRVGRTFQGVREQATVRLRVVAVLPIGAFPRQAAFVRLPLLEATEDFRDGRASVAFGWSGRPPPEGSREYPSFRLYARSIYEVAALRDLLTAQGLEIYTKAEDIAVVKSLDRAFTLIFQLIAIVAVFGYFASMASSVLANVKRKSRHLGVIRLIGFSTSSMVWFPMIQAIATGLLGTGAAIGLYLITEAAINRLFAPFLGPGEYVCHLGPVHVLVALGLTLAMSILASAFAAVQVARIEPSEVIRDV